MRPNAKHLPAVSMRSTPSSLSQARLAEVQEEQSPLAKEPGSTAAFSSGSSLGSMSELAPSLIDKVWLECNDQYATDLIV